MKVVEELKEFFNVSTLCVGKCVPYLQCRHYIVLVQEFSQNHTISTVASIVSSLKWFWTGFIPF